MSKEDKDPPIISEFQGEYRFLSNFYPLQMGILWYGRVWPTLEHAFQATKTVIEEEREAIILAKTPGLAKKMGRAVTLREDWENIKLAVMYELLKLKFAPHRDLTTKLIRTVPAKLIEGNAWNDTTWGAVWRNGEWVGENWLGRLLMLVRSDLFHEFSFNPPPLISTSRKLIDF